MFANTERGSTLLPRRTLDPALFPRRSFDLSTVSGLRRQHIVATPALTGPSPAGNLNGLAPSPLGGLWRSIGAGCTGPDKDEHSMVGSRCDRMYGRALKAARLQDFEVSKDAFEELLEEYPGMCKAWVSYAQMVKRCNKQEPQHRWARVREVLQRGMTFNPHSACLAQAWGLMELQKGNFLGATMLLERSVSLDPACSPVLKWQPVRRAKVEMSIRRRLKASS